MDSGGDIMDVMDTCARNKRASYAIITKYRMIVTAVKDVDDGVLTMIRHIRDHKAWGAYTCGGYLRLGWVKSLRDFCPPESDIKYVELPRYSISDSIGEEHGAVDTFDIPDAYKTPEAIAKEKEYRSSTAKHGYTPEEELAFMDYLNSLSPIDRIVAKHQENKGNEFYFINAQTRAALYKKKLLAQPEFKLLPTKMALERVQSLVSLKMPLFKKLADKAEARMKARKKQLDTYRAQYKNAKWYSVWDWEAEDDVCCGGNPVTFFKREEAEAFLQLVKSGQLDGVIDEPVHAPTTEKLNERNLLKDMDEADLKDYRERVGK